MSIFTQNELDYMRESRLGRGFDPQIIRLHPVKIIAWGIDEQRQSRKVNVVHVEANINRNHVIV